MRTVLLALVAWVVFGASLLGAGPAEAGHRHHHRHFFGHHAFRHHGFFHHGHFYSPYHSSYAYAPGYYYYGRGAYGPVRIEGTPKDRRDETRVFVNGAEVGVVDDFDGFSQRLYLRPGREYDLELRLEGYEPLRQRIFVTPDRTYKIRYDFEAAAPGSV